MDAKELADLTARFGLPIVLIFLVLWKGLPYLAARSEKSEEFLKGIIQQQQEREAALQDRYEKIMRETIDAITANRQAVERLADQVVGVRDDVQRLDSHPHRRSE